MGSKLIAGDKIDMDNLAAEESMLEHLFVKNERTPNKKKTKNTQSVTRKRKAPNIPDLLQDVPICKQSRKKEKRKSELERKRELLREFMKNETQVKATAEQAGDDTSMDVQKDQIPKEKTVFKAKLSLQDNNNNSINLINDKKSNKGKLEIENEFATITSVDIPANTATFFKLAASKVEKLRKKNHQVAVKTKVAKVGAHTPKRVCFEMSKTMVSEV